MMDKIIPDGGYAPEEDTPFNLYKDAGKHDDVNSRITLAERRKKKLEKRAAKKDSDVFMEKIGPGIEIPVPGLTKAGGLKRKAQRGEELQIGDGVRFTGTNHAGEEGKIENVRPDGSYDVSIPSQDPSYSESVIFVGKDELEKIGARQKSRVKKTSAVTMDWFNRMSQGITDNLNRIDMVINRFDADDMFHEIEEAFVPDFEAAARALGKIADGFDSGKY